MTTTRRHLVLGFLLCASGCSRIGDGIERDPAATSAPGGKASVAAYDPRDGFVVHEWGTFTSVSGSDGVLLPGLHHEEEDLPGFVADRMKAAKDQPELAFNPGSQKMETPVTYFYSPTSMKVSAKVGFPSGIFTQWYPFVATMTPHVADVGGTDRYQQATAEIPEACRRRWKMQDGLLDWADFEVLGPGEHVFLPGPVDGTTWGFARNTAANPLRIAHASSGGPQYEKFLFYRGLGDLAFPVKVTIGGDTARIANEDPARMGGIVLMNVTRDAAGFVELGDLAGGAAASSRIPDPKMPHAEFVQALKTALATRLVASGLYSDEARAMVDTWERSYFLTPGVRLLYLLPQAITDRTIPLTISPSPAKLARTMVIRMELVPPSQERKLTGWLTALAAGSPDARQSFLGLGRFAQPQLTRAIALATSEAEKAAGEKLLVEIQKKHRSAPTAVD